VDDLRPLRRTVRRCTAVVVAAIGIATWAVADIGAALYGGVLSLCAFLYLAGSLVYTPEWATDDTDAGGPGT
jgi:hypothetical protein